MRAYTFFSLLPLLSFGQEIYVRSEFQRPGADGAVIKVDRMNQRSREIVSPGALRNGYTSLHVTLEAPAGTPITLYIGHNPENAIATTLYVERENDLEEVKKLPFAGRIPESGALNFLLDMWVKADAVVQRVKIEPQLWVPDRWIVYPMEVRVLEKVVPKHIYAPAILPEPSVRADTIVYPRMRELLCGKALAPGPKLAAPTVLSIIDRNLAQDIAMARRLPATALTPLFIPPTGVAQPAEWCRATERGVLEPLPVEWFLRVRDNLYRAGVN